MATATLKFDQEKETKGTFRFRERVEDGGTPVIGPLYLRKSFLGDAAPDTVTVTVEA